MLWVVIENGQIVEVCDYRPMPRDGETVTTLEDAIALGLPYA
jgi:hypothetical protein